MGPRKPSENGMVGRGRDTPPGGGERASLLGVEEVWSAPAELGTFSWGGLGTGLAANGWMIVGDGCFSMGWVSEFLWLFELAAS